MAFGFGLQPLYLKYFTKIFQFKGLKPKYNGQKYSYECCDLTKKVYLTYTLSLVLSAKMVNDAIPIMALLLLACNNSTLTLTKITLIWNLIQNIFSICFVQKIIFELSISEIIISWDYCLLVCQLILCIVVFIIHIIRHLSIWLNLLTLIATEIGISSVLHSTGITLQYMKL